MMMLPRVDGVFDIPHNLQVDGITTSTISITTNDPSNPTYSFQLSVLGY
jgi:hypothetical protein